ncbi:MAG: HlyD family secretion protein [Anaerolineae bacterium]
MRIGKILITFFVILVVAGLIYRYHSIVLSFFGLSVSGQTGGISPGIAITPARDTSATAKLATLTTTPIRRATDTNSVSAAGNIELAAEYPVVLQVGGIVSQVAVQVGDVVAAGDLLIALDTTDLERAVTRAELNLSSAQAQLDKLREPADPAEIAAAEASLEAARQKLADLEAGPSKAELAAAQANLAAAKAKYEELKAGPSEAELTKLKATLEQATIDLQQAQWAYDQVSYKGDVGASSQAAALQKATIAFNAAKAEYEIAAAPPTESELQSALNAIYAAQEQLDALRKQPTQAELATARAEVASAQYQLDQLTKGPDEAELRAAEIAVEQARLDLEEAQANLARAKLQAPVSGVVLSVGVEVGQQVQAGLTAVTLANLSQLQLTVNVAEVDIIKVHPGQKAEITVDALPNKVLAGEVSRVAPASTSTSGVVNYPVTIRLTDAALEDVRPGMTAVATLLGEQMANTWLVPTNALTQYQGQTVAMIVRDGKPVPIAVVPHGTQGEWTIVQSPELREGDQALGSVSSHLESEGTSGSRGTRGGIIMGPPPPGP